MNKPAGFSISPVLVALAISFSSFAQARELTRVPGVDPVPAPVAQVQAALAGVTRALSANAQVAVFPYRQNKIYQVGIKPGMFTTFMLPKDEPIQQFAVSNPDAAEVTVNADANAAMLKLLSEITLSATIVTTKRAYYMTISPSADSWHQGVSWSYDETTASGFGYRAPSNGKAAQAAQPQQDMTIPPDDDGLGGHPNFNYQVEGDAAILPVAVWDNGRFTWLQFSDSIQSLPAVFFLGPDGPEVVNYVVQPGGKQVKVNRLMSRVMLRLGSQKATVTAK